MRIEIDTTTQQLTLRDAGSQTELPLYSEAAFQAISKEYVRLGSALGHTNTFSWFGLPLPYLPEDMVSLQGVIYRLRPDVILHAGVSGRGLLLFLAGLCRAMGSGRVEGVDRSITAETRAALLKHAGSHQLRLSEVDPERPSGGGQEVLRTLLDPGASVFVIVNSANPKDLDFYSRWVTVGSHLLSLGPIPEEFLNSHPEFCRFELPPMISGASLVKPLTLWNDCWLKRVA